ncbi:MAG: hypothetical protein DMF25_01430 [Verrucomicrobia bacterium]|nr:MAG: hypothetical protein DMF25_01430 [Verrucomicrobiota bacterium]
MTEVADVIIVGSGPAGAAAALELCAKRKVLMLDIGHTAQEVTSQTNRFRETFGEELEGLSHISGTYLSPKLRSPLFRYVTRGWRELSPITSTDFKGELSLALGGLANAWGSGLYEFDDTDLRGFPIKYSDLSNFYRRLTEHIGISGGTGEVARLLGSVDKLLPPMPLAGPPRALYLRSQRPRAKAFLRRNGIRIGKQRLGILTESYRGRPAYLFDRKDFFLPWKTSIYHPGYTVRELEKHGNLDYRQGFLVKRFEEVTDHVVVHAIELANGNAVEFSARKLLLGAGAINSARIVLESFSDNSSKLPILENPVSFTPFIHFSSLGLKPDETSFTGAQLVLLYDGPEHRDRVQGSFYNLSGVLPCDFLFDFPFSVSGNLFCLSKILGAMGVLQLFYADAPHPEGFLRRTTAGALEVHYPQRRVGKVERRLIRALSRLGFWSAPPLIRYGEGGGSFHYAGTLPMCDESEKNEFTTDRFGRLRCANNVYVVDASTFPLLPAKNLSLTIMANAMRIASKLIL